MFETIYIPDLEHFVSQQQSFIAKLTKKPTYSEFPSIHLLKSVDADRILILHYKFQGLCFLTVLSVLLAVLHDMQDKFLKVINLLPA